MDLTQKLIFKGGVIVAQLLIVVLIYFLSDWKGVVDRSANLVQMRYNPPMRMAGLLMLILGLCFPLFVIVLVVVKPPDEAWQYPALAAMAAAIALGGWYEWRETREGYALITEEGIERSSPWWGTKLVKWREVATLEIAEGNVVVIRTHQGKKIVFPIYWTGLDLLAQAGIRNMPAKSIVDRREQVVATHRRAGR